MKKILISTWVEYDNYGSLLQAYCLKEMLSDLYGKDGCVDVRLLNFQSDQRKKTDSFADVFKKLREHSVKENIVKALGKVLIRTHKKKISERGRKFAEFREKKLNLYPEKAISSYGELRKIDKFDLYIAGGDQIWNPKLLDEVYLLSWVPQGAVKISYAPSVCVNRLSSDELERYQALGSFKAISVREYTGAVEQISDFIHRKITEVADPVILYGREELLKKCKKSDTSGYAVVYLLNGKSKQHGTYADFLKKSGLEVKVIPTLKSDNLFFEAVLSKNVDWGIGPEEFVNLIYNAEMLITDSFHGTIVALLLHKDFVVLPREGGGSEQNNRLLELLRKVGLEERFGGLSSDSERNSVINWDEIDTRMERMKRYSRDFLIKAISGKYDIG